GQPPRAPLRAGGASVSGDVFVVLDSQILERRLVGVAHALDRKFTRRLEANRIEIRSIVESLVFTAREIFRPLDRCRESNLLRGFAPAYDGRHRNRLGSVARTVS